MRVDAGRYCREGRILQHAPETKRESSINRRKEVLRND